MKRIFIITTAIAFLVACSSSENTDKRKKLSELITKKAEISAQIKAIKKELEASTNNKNIPYVSSEKINTGIFNHFIEVQGNVNSDNNIFIPSEASGIVKKLYITEGQKVEAGQVLAKLDDILVKKQKIQLETNLALARTIFEKQERLWNSKIGKEIDYLQAKTQKESLESQLDLINEQIAKTEIKAPIAGTIDKINLKVGEMASAGKSAIRIVQISDLKISSELSEHYVSDVNVGDPVSVKIPSTNSEFKTSIISKSKVINASNRTFTIEVAIPASYKNVKPNMLARLVINDYQNANALTVPINAVINSIGSKYVYIAKQQEGKLIAVQRVVKVGKFYNSEIEILEGLQAGEELISFGFQNLSDGQEVAIGKLD